MRYRRANRLLRDAGRPLSQRARCAGPPRRGRRAPRRREAERARRTRRSRARAPPRACGAEARGPGPLGRRGARGEVARVRPTGKPRLAGGEPGVAASAACCASTARAARRSRGRTMTGATTCSTRPRKQTKYLAKALEVLGPAPAASAMAKRAELAESIADALGDDHDLAVLCERIAKRSDARDLRSAHRGAAPQAPAEGAEGRPAALPGEGEGFGTAIGLRERLRAP